MSSWSRPRARPVRGAQREPLIHQGGSDGFLAPRAADRSWRTTAGASTSGPRSRWSSGDVPIGADRGAALAAIRLVTLINDVSLRDLIPGELARGLGFFQSKPASGAAPVAVAPAALGDAWDGAKLHGALVIEVNGRPFGRADAGVDADFDFGDLIVHAARTRALGAGTIIGSGTVSNRGSDGGPAAAIDAGGCGFGCIAEARMAEALRDGAARTPYLRFGDTVRVEMRDAERAFDLRRDRAASRAGLTRNAREAAGAN